MQTTSTPPSPLVPPPTVTLTPPVIPSQRRMVLARVATVAAYAVVPVAVLVALIAVADQNVRRVVVGLLAFGLWTIGCIVFGKHIASNQSVAKLTMDIDRMFNWIRTGRPEPTKNGETKPPVDIQEKRHSFRL